MRTRILVLTLLSVAMAAPALGQQPGRRKPFPKPEPLAPLRTIDPGEVEYILDGITIPPRKAVAQVRERSNGGIRFYYAALRDDLPVWVFDAVTFSGNLNADVHGEEGWLFHPPRWRQFEPRWVGEDQDWVFFDINGSVWIFDAHDKIEAEVEGSRVFAAEVTLDQGETPEDGVIVHYLIDAIVQGEAVRFKLDEDLEILEQGPTPEPVQELNPLTAEDGRAKQLELYERGEHPAQKKDPEDGGER